MSACGCTDPECRLTGCKAEKAMENPQRLVGAPIVEGLSGGGSAGGGKGPCAEKTVWITYGNPPPDPRDEEIARLKEALKTAQSWLEIWALHVGECRGGIRCECGLTNARYEASAALNGEKE